MPPVHLIPPPRTLAHSFTHSLTRPTDATPAGIRNQQTREKTISQHIEEYWKESGCALCVTAQALRQPHPRKSSNSACTMHSHEQIRHTVRTSMPKKRAVFRACNDIRAPMLVPRRVHHPRFSMRGTQTAAQLQSEGNGMEDWGSYIYSSCKFHRSTCAYVYIAKYVHTAGFRTRLP
eukprot:GHVU01203305.1.p1 GENE.GHVU01203305.1~~GHVU01203305.1.p1  ORF type:complete len:177 (+),score=0.36 GHVU01203305.1:603-1133(+)